MKKTFKKGTSITFNRQGSPNHGKVGTIVSKRDKETSPIGVMLEGKTNIVWTAAKFLTVNNQITDSVTTTTTGIKVGDKVKNTGRGAYAGKSGVVKKIRTGSDNNIGVNYKAGMITWTKESNLTVVTSASSTVLSFSIGDSVVGNNTKTKNYGKMGVVNSLRADGRVGVMFEHKDDLVWCKPSNLALNYAAGTTTTVIQAASSNSIDHVVINFHGVNVTVSKECNVVVTPTGISVN